MIYFLIIISFYLDGLCSMLFKTSLFFPLFTLVSLMLIYPYFKRYGNSFLKVCFLVGLLYDIVYTNMIFIHSFLFCILGYIVGFLYHMFNKNFWTLLFMNFIMIIIYQVLNFTLFLLSAKVQFSFQVLLNSIFYSILSNFLYIIILYGILRWLLKYKKIEIYH
ncbi:MAG: rod shape-determining protein MreD [Bacilli bacterium]|nr:rod shape-determining protein MreD [Bacilli bacterium]